MVTLAYFSKIPSYLRAFGLAVGSVRPALQPDWSLCNVWILFMAHSDLAHKPVLYSALELYFYFR